MKEIVIVVNLVSLVMMIVVLTLFIRGIIILFTGRCKLRKYLVTGKEAKPIGLSFVIVPIVLFVIWAILYENFNWGSSRNEFAILASPLVQSILFIIGASVVYLWSLSRARAFQVELNEQNDKQADINKPELKIDIQKTESKIEQDQEVKKSQVSKPPPDISGKKDRTIIEGNLEFSIIDFYKENEQIINFGLAQSKPDINFTNWYRVTANDKSVISPKDGLLFKNARIICGGKVLEGGYDRIVKLEHPDLQTPEGDLLMQMEGVLRFWSKCMFTCTCGLSYLIYADATVGKANECYLTVYTVNTPENLISFVRPFFETDEVAIVSL